jgi:hypothetical protein
VPGVGTIQGGANNKTGQYKAAYTDQVFGPIICAGVHKVGKNWPGTATSGGRDSFACTSTTGSPLLGVTPGEVLEVNGWQSDYFTLLGIAVVSTRPAIFTVSPDGMSFSASVIYPV